LFFDVNAPDALPMDKIIFAEHDYIQPVGMSRWRISGQFHAGWRGEGQRIIPLKKRMWFLPKIMFFSPYRPMRAGGRASAGPRGA
jgi:hypothetical protein